MPGATLIDSGLIERFRADLERLTGAPPSADRKLGIAVSGGSDSLGLLLLAHSAFPDAIAAATVDHGLRPEAADEARAVEAICAGLGVPHRTLRAGPHYDATAIANVQDRARNIRYHCLTEWARAEAIVQVAVAHQRDDVAESFLMRAGRGAGVRSLAAMAAVRTLGFTGVLLIRPLLGWTRAELAAIVATANIVAVVDPSNTDPRFDRARIRRLLAERSEIDPGRLARTATNLRDVEEAVEWMVLRDLRARFEDGEADSLWLRADDLPFELKRRFVLRAIEDVRQQNGMFEAWRPSAVANLVRALEAGGGGTVAEVQARARNGRWHFRPAPPRRTG